MKLNSFIKNHKWKLSILSLVVCIYLLIPLPEFHEPCSTVIYSAEGKLLGAQIATDEQWRFPVMDSVPNKFSTCIQLFEDEWFPYHPGINPVSIFRAMSQNIKASRVVSGGSTLTMQTVRLARKGKSRTFTQKCIEMLLATRFELRYSKKEIMQLYASNAPFGSNVVGIEAASWRYFGRPPENITWAEAATLAVLPNAPALIYPGRNQTQLKHKRDKLLKKLYEHEYIDSLSYALSLKEALPGKPNRIPQLAPHLLQLIKQDNAGQRITTSLPYYKQKEAVRLVNNHSKRLAKNQIHNTCAIIVDNETKEILAYVGNSTNNRNHNNDVDIIQAARSTGSILKPFLFAAMINEGEILPNTLVPDIPMYYEGFAPRNYDLNYDGAVGATQALARSLNVPSVHMLKDYGLDRFHNLLQRLQLSSVNKASDHYGLSLILGGAEAKLYNLVHAYSGMAHTLSFVPAHNYQYATNSFAPLSYLKTSKPESSTVANAPIYSAASIWCTFEAMQEVNRPDNESGWKSFSSAMKIAWKTGTSYGFRDAWAIGVSPQYTIGVWVGNADGEGRPGLTGVTAAAPLLFQLFSMMQPEGWFQQPYDEFTEARICKESGHLASMHCPHVDTLLIPEVGLRTTVCPYHKTVHLDKTERHQVNAQCMEADSMVSKSWFILPPSMAYYFAKRNAWYKNLPPLKAGCEISKDAVMEFIYPKNIRKIFIPIDVDGKKGDVVFEVAHRNPNQKLYWHIDNEFVGITEKYHQLAVSPDAGKHTVTVVDESGNAIDYDFEVVY